MGTPRSGEDQSLPFTGDRCTIFGKRAWERDIEKLGATFVAFTAQTRMSGVNLNGREVRKEER